MKEIPLTQGMVALVDNEDYADLMQFKWHAAVKGTYAGRTVHRNGKKTYEFMHRRILNAKPGERVDHKNHNSLDNQRANIRLCTQSQNMGNMKRRTDGVSEFKGVAWHKRNGVWQSGIKRNGKRTNLGCFAKEEDAARAYDDAARKMFGDFALTNFQ